jgi:hypothetical protein
MNEPHLIRNDSPHQVSLAEGGNLAFGKKAEALVPLERAVAIGTDAPMIDHSVSDVFLVAVPETALEAPAPEQPTFQREVKEAHALVPESLPEPAKAVFVPTPAVVASPASASATARVEPSYLAAAPVVAPQKMLPMDFPARVINLKIESDKVRSKLEALQASIRN